MNAEQLQKKLITEMGLHNPGAHNALRVKFFLEDLAHEPPEGCLLAVGDKVTYTNPAGVKFNTRVFGFVAERAKPSYTSGRNVFLMNESYWFPVPMDSLKKL